MGLDISAVSKLEPIEVPEDMEKWSDEWYDWESEQDGDVYSVYSSNALLLSRGTPVPSL